VGRHSFRYGSPVVQGAAANPGVTLPWWLAVPLAVIAVLAPVLTGWLTYRAATKQTTVTKSQAHQVLIMDAWEQVCSSDLVTSEKGWALLEAIAAMDLSRDEAIMIQSLTHPTLRSRLEQMRLLQEEKAKPPRLWRRRR
jgi:hypothetical protein